MKGLFIPDITAEMFRNGCLESIEALMAEGKIYDIDYQQPCEDCISRKQAVSVISDLLMIDLKGKRLPTWNEVYNALGDLPSVTPQPKTGKWIKTEGEINGFGDWGQVYECSCCVKTQRYPSNFCSYCGANMRGDGNGK